jgi:hypothetical protein
MSIAVGIFIDMINPAGVKCACPADQAMNFIALVQKHFGKIRAILPGNARNQCSFQLKPPTFNSKFEMKVYPVDLSLSNNAKMPNQVDFELTNSLSDGMIRHR